MNKFKAWLIRKLGGCVYLESTERIVYKTLPCVTLCRSVLLPPKFDREFFNLNESEIEEMIKDKVCREIGYAVYNGGLFECEMHDEDNGEQYRKYIIRVVNPRG